MKLVIVALITAGSLLLMLQAQTNSPSLGDTFDWMTNTLKQTEGNNVVTHYPTQRPYVKEWRDKEINPYHKEVITGFSHDGCRVAFDLEVTDNDMGLLLGKYFLLHQVDRFDLKDIDPQSVQIKNSCEAVETPSGPVEPWNCEDMRGKFVVFQTVDAKPKIHEDGSSSSGKSNYGRWGVRTHMKYNLDEMCKDANANGDAGNGAYCDQPDTKQTPKELTSSTLGFASPDYAKRFAKAFRHAVELCGGKASAF